jgi:hypothetical protein
MLLDELKKLLVDSGELRDFLVTNMNNLEKKGMNCSSCSGLCCTVTKNSMQVTPMEAMDLYLYLSENIQDQNLLWKNIEESVLKYGLDREIYVKNKLLRKNYTCPLFKFESWGCPVTPAKKPFGCLGFNAFKAGVVNGESCNSDVELLSKVDQQIHLKLLDYNQKINKLVNLNFDKLPIPNALIKIRTLILT